MSPGQGDGRVAAARPPAQPPSTSGATCSTSGGAPLSAATVRRPLAVALAASLTLHLPLLWPLLRPTPPAPVTAPLRATVVLSGVDIAPPLPQAESVPGPALPPVAAPAVAADASAVSPAPAASQATAAAGRPNRPDVPREAEPPEATEYLPASALARPPWMAGPPQFDGERIRGQNLAVRLSVGPTGTVDAVEWLPNEIAPASLEALARSVGAWRFEPGRTVDGRAAAAVLSLLLCFGQDGALAAPVPECWLPAGAASK